MRRALPLFAALLAACATTSSPDAAETAAAAAAVPASVAQGANAFGVDLYRLLSRDRGNVFVSPVSISTAFGLAFAGARGATAEEIARTLRYPARGEALNEQMGTLLRALATNEPPLQRLAIANALWVQRGFTLRPEYLELTRSHYGAAPTTLDFSRPPEAVAHINRWAEEHSNGLIRGLLTPSDVDAATRLVLTNTVYFLGAWAEPFSTESTRDEDFHASAGTRRTPLMNQLADFPYFETGDFQAASLAYRGSDFAMAVFLPRRRGGLAAFERSLTAERLERWLRRLDEAEHEPRYLALTLPRLRFGARYELPPALAELGMTTPFTDLADFTGIAPARLAISRVIHQTFLSVDEAGTEAAAATAVTIIVTGSRIPPPPVIFRADHPFFFVIRHRSTGSIVFMGRIEAPELG